MLESKGNPQRAFGARQVVAMQQCATQQPMRAGNVGIRAQEGFEELACLRELPGLHQASRQAQLLSDCRGGGGHVLREAKGKDSPVGGSSVPE